MADDKDDGLPPPPKPGTTQKPVEDVAKDIIEKDAAGDKGRPGKEEVAEKPRRTAVLIATGVATVVVLAVGGIVLAGGGDDPTPSPEDDTATTVDVPTTESSTATTVAAAPGTVSGTYAGTVTVAGDPAGHACCVKPTTTWEILQVRDTATGAITITLSDVVEGIDLTGPLADTGERFTATGSGTVAGYPNTDVSFTGTVSPEDGIDGTLAVGRNGTLPQGEPIAFTVDMARQPGTELTLDASDLQIRFVQSEFATHYSVQARSLVGGPITYSWSLTPPTEEPNCDNLGNATGDKSEFVWLHGDQHDCDHTKQGPLGHKGTVKLVVSDGRTECTSSYTGSQGANDQPDATAPVTCALAG